MSLSYLETSLDRIDAAARDDVIEICINPDGTCWGEFQGDHFMRALDQRLTGVQVRDLGNQIASSANTTMSKDRPIVSVSITYKGRPIRAQVITPPAVLSAMSISLRFFSSLPLEGIALDFLYGKERKLEDLRVEKKRALRAVVAAGLIDDALAFCVENKLNMIVSGGTSTGKTTLTNALLAEVARTDDRVVLIEDTRELQCAAPNLVALRTKDNVASLSDLVRSSLRLRPDRIPIGEVRGSEALDLLKAWGTGHPGGIGTIHAGTALGALRRMEQLIQEAVVTVPRALIAETIDLVAVLSGRGSARKLSELARVEGLGPDRDYRLKSTNQDKEGPIDA